MIVTEVNAAVVRYDRRHFRPDKFTKTQNWIHFHAPEVPEIANHHCALRFVFFRNLVEDWEAVTFPECTLINDIPVLPLCYVFCAQLEIWASKCQNQEPGIKTAKKHLVCCFEVIVKKPPMADYEDALTLFPRTQQSLAMFESHHPEHGAMISLLRRELGLVSSQTSFIEPEGTSAFHHVQEPKEIVLGPPLSVKEVADDMMTLKKIASDVVAVITSLGFRSTFFGSMACNLYGNRRIPEVSLP